MIVLIDSDGCLLNETEIKTLRLLLSADFIIYPEGFGNRVKKSNQDILVWIKILD